MFDRNHQKLVDIMFEIAITLNSMEKKLDNQDVMQWVREQLFKCGFPTTPIGASWGVLNTGNKK